ncbi:MAG: DUF4270 family protein [Bacteroidales bacterium]|nr:DUF4270 family protein [Bacteroidales bacterium]
MKKIINILLVLAAAMAGAALFASCTEEPSNIGVGLQDPATLFDGKRDTVMLTAFTMLEDSLKTSGYSSAVIGNYSDGVFGTVRGTYYTQITNSNGIAFDDKCVIDSVVLTLVLSDVYPPAGDSYSLHFRVDQLAEAPMTDSAYYAFDTIALGGACFFDGMVNVTRSDTMTARLKLRDNASALFARQTLNARQLIDYAKGIRIALNDDDKMVTINLAAEKTRITIHYRYDNIVREVNLGIGKGGTHFSHYTHQYAGSSLAPFATTPNDSMPGTNFLYLEPFGGTYLCVDMRAWIDTFRVAHPNAVINYAVMRLPIATSESDNYHPDKLQTYKQYADGSSIGIPDMLDAYTYTGYDGTNKIDSTCYRIRITQHLQKMLLSGNDFGTLIYLDGRRSSPRRVVINGTAKQNPICVEVVYSE